MSVAELNGQFRFHAGDDLRYADPSFDDPGWFLLKSGRGWYTQGYRNYAGFGWYRFRVTVPAGSDIALLVPLVVYESCDEV